MSRTGRPRLPDDQVSKDTKRQRLYRKGILVSREQTPEEIEERKQKMTERSREYYRKAMEDEEKRAAAAERSRLWREKNRDKARDYINAYMREYNKKRYAEQRAKKAEEKRLKELAKIEEQRQALQKKESELTEQQRRYRDQVEKAKKMLETNP